MMRKIDKLILHHSDSEAASHDDISVIRKWHTDPKEIGGRGWRDVGYHYFIKTNGEVQKGRDETAVGAHCKGENIRSIGICLHGKSEFTQKQFTALAELLQELLKRYPGATIHGHNEFADKDCPVFDIDDFLEDYFSNIDSINVNG